MSKKVVLDAGHGITTAGKRSFDGSLREYEFNRSIAWKMKAILERHGVTVVLTCPTDADVTLAGRVAIEHQERPDIFVSLHANAYGTSWNTSRGWEIFISARGGNREILANKIHARAIPYLGVPDRGVKTGDLYVLNNTYAPAVLIEHEFMTCQDSVALLKSDDWRNKCALANSQGILDYFGIAYQEPVQAPAPPPATPTEDVWRIFVNGTKVISLTGFEKSKSYAIANYPNDDVYLENTRTLEKVIVCSKPVVVTPTIDYETQVIRVFVDGVKVISLTGYTKCVNYANANCQGKHVELECVADLKKWDLGTIPLVVAQPEPEPQPEVPAPTPVVEKHLAMSQAEITVEQAETYLHKINPNAPFYAQIYKDEAEKEGARWDVAFAQTLKETGNFKFGGDALPEWNNFAGIGVTGVDYDPTTAIEKPFVDGVVAIWTPDNKSVGVKFATPTLGIRGQVQHLKAYSSTEALVGECVDPRFRYITRGKAPYIEDYGNGVWASDKDNYGGKIWDIVVAMKNTIADPDVMPKPEPIPEEPIPQDPQPPVEEEPTEEVPQETPKKNFWLDLLRAIVDAIIKFFEKKEEGK